MKRQLLNVLVLSALAAPCFIGLAPIMRVAFPGAAFMIAVYLATSKLNSQYITYCIWVFFLTPLVRRLVDLQVGWAEPNYLLLAPYLVLLPAVVIALPRMFLTRNVTWLTGAAIIFGCAIYGLLLASLAGRPVAAGFDFLKWVAPLCFGVAVYVVAGIDDELEAEVKSVLILSVALTGAYAIYQFMLLPPWDVYWMRNVKMDSIGKPFPYEIRGFSTLNSPGSYGFIVAECLIFLICFNVRQSGIALLLGLAGMLFTLSRSAWGGFLVGCLSLLVFGPVNVRTRVLLLAVIVAVGGPSLLILPQVQTAVIDRMETIFDVRSDVSFLDRSESYARAISQFGGNVFGTGIGINGTYQSYADGGPSLVIDGGPIEIFMALGFPVGLIFFLAFSAILIGVIRINGPPSQLLSGCKASVVAAAALLFSSTVTSGELGLFVWLAIGLAYGIRERMPVSGQYVTRAAEDQDLSMSTAIQKHLERA